MTVFSFTKGPKVYILFTIILILLILIAIGSVTCYGMLLNENIYQNISAGNVDLSNKSREDAEKAIGDYIASLQNETIRYSLADKTFELSLTNVDYDCDIQQIIDDAFRVGREGNVFHKIAEIINVKHKGKKIALPIQIDRKTLKDEISAYAEKNGLALGDFTYEVLENSIIIRPSTSEKKIDIDALMDDFITKIQNSNFTDGTPVPISKVDFNRNDVDYIYNEIKTDPIDAKYEEKNGIMCGIESKDGISFDKEAAKKILSEEKNEYIIPIIRTKANVSLETLDLGMFKDLISVFTTSFPANPSRVANIKIATDKINNCVLMPGQVFSFNQVVGPRTAAAGYQNATIYTAAGLEDGLAGGICQVSSTLYNTVILADLDIQARTNHTYTVHYVPLGFDATVSYGSIDFKFKNSLDHAIKIKANVTAGSITISINGIKSEANKVIKTRNKIISTTPPEDKEVVDLMLQSGERVKKQSGQAGYIVEAYKDVYIDGNLVRTQVLPRSNYIPLNAIYAVGIAASSPPAQSDPATPAPSMTQTPVPDQSPPSIPPQNPEPSALPPSDSDIS